MLSDDVESEDEDGQRRYKRQILRELYAECITGVLGPGTAAIDAHFATASFMTRIKVFWRMQEDGSLAPSSRSILTGWRMARTLSTWRSFRIVPAGEMRCGMDRTMYA